MCVAGRGEPRLHRRTLDQTLARSSWPLLDYIDVHRARFGVAPRYVIACSSDGHSSFYPGYDYVAAAKALLEALCSELARELPTSRINVVRARQVDTSSFREAFDSETRAAIGQFPEFDISAESVADAIFELSSGQLDSLTGQTLVLDKGATRFDNLVNIAPRLQGESSQAGLPTRSGPARARAVLCIAGRDFAPKNFDFGRPTRWINPQAAETIDAGDVPESVVVLHDWRVMERSSWVASARLLVELLERAEEKGGRAPRYGVQIDVGHSPAMALSRSLANYWQGWRCGLDMRINFVRGSGPEVFDVARSLVSGRLDSLSSAELAAATW